MCLCVCFFFSVEKEKPVSEVDVSAEEEDSYTKRLVIHSYMLNYQSLGTDTDKSPHNDWDSYLIIICNL